jgi:glycosyltransferase involved in cell wall biosynthesis
MSGAFGANVEQDWFGFVLEFYKARLCNWFFLCRNNYAECVMASAYDAADSGSVVLRQVALTRRVPNEMTTTLIDAAHMAEAPIVTITFVAWMREELLRRGIESALALKYRPIEIVVVDNSPSDDIHQWLARSYPTVKSIKTFAPLPLPLVRNMLVATARGKYVVFHDDDSRFSEIDGLSSAVEYLENHPNVACLAFKQGNERGEWNGLFDGSAIRETFTYIACAVMFRREDYFSAGGYFEKYSLYGEELVLSLAFFGLGKEIHFYPFVPIIHEQVMNGRVADPGKRYHIADIVMTPGAILLKAPLPDVLFWYPAWLAWTTAKVCLFQRRPFVAIRGMTEALLWAFTFLKNRGPIERKEFRRWLKVRRQYLSRKRA